MMIMSSPATTPSSSSSSPPSILSLSKLKSNKICWACFVILLLSLLHSTELKSFVSRGVVASTRKTTTETTITTSTISTSRSTTLVAEEFQPSQQATITLEQETVTKIVDSSAGRRAERADHNKSNNKSNKTKTKARKSQNTSRSNQHETQQPDHVLLRLQQQQPHYDINFTLAKEIGCCEDVGNGDRCKNTCFTQRACGVNADPFYPYESQEEKEWFDTQEPQDIPLLRQYRMGQRLFCDEYMDRDPIHPPKWCQQQQQQQSSSFISSTTTHRIMTAIMNLTLIPTRCYSMGARSGPFDRTVLIPKSKLMFCGIPKVGITQWLKFSRFIFGAVDYQSMPYFKADVSKFRFARLSRNRQEEVLNDPSWTKAIFLRDPAERLMSAYLDKVENKLLKEKRAWQSSSSTTPPQDLYNITFQTKASVFAEWVRSLETEPAVSCQGRRGPSWCWDPHWRPQVYSCGIRELLPHFDFVGSLSQAANHSRALLEKVNLWDEYGAKYLVSGRTENLPLCTALPPNPSREKHVFRGGFQQNVLAKKDQHTTDSQSKMGRYFTPEIWDIVKRLYKEDYDLWNALNQQENESWAHGSVLSARLNPECASNNNK